MFFFSTWTANAAFDKREDGLKTGLDRNERFEDPFREKPSRIGPPGGGGTGTPAGPETGVPVRDALPILLGLGVIYGVYIFGKKKKEA